MKMIENEMNVAVPIEIVKASDIEPKEVKWLWYPYIPFGKVTLLQGDPGDGKSKFMLSLAALLSKGEHLPFADEEEREPITIIYQTTEDDADDTVVPRFNSAGGNGDNLIFIKEDMKSCLPTIAKQNLKKQASRNRLSKRQRRKQELCRTRKAFCGIGLCRWAICREHKNRLSDE